jgi:protoheme IX farnesyltransferase
LVTVARRSDDRSASPPRRWGGVVDHLVLLKPRVMSLVVFTGAVGFALAPGPIDWMKLLAALSTMAGGAGACGALNMWWDADIDAKMARTAMRPIPRGTVPPGEALAIGVLLAIVSVAALAISVNWLSAALLALTIAIYIPLYTMVLKRSTPLNIVIGGAAGALPPVIGWAAAANSLAAGPIAMFLITFLWTPPHFWALALMTNVDYERAGIPMLPNVAGIARTKREIVIYSLVLVAVSLAFFPLHVLGPCYGGCALILGAVFLWDAWKVSCDSTKRYARVLFKYSLLYLALMCVAMVADRVI